MASEVRSLVSRSDRDDNVAAKLRRDGEARLRFSRPMVELLDGLSVRLNLPVVDVITHAVVLLKVAVDSQVHGQRLCLLDDDGNIRGEVVDFGMSEGVGIDPFPEIEADRDA